MKKPIFLILFLLGSYLVYSQQSYYLSYENGVKSDRFFYLNQNAQSYHCSTIDGVFGVNFGYRFKKGFTLESGFQGFYSSNPMIDYDRINNTIIEPTGSGGSSGMDSWIIPLRFGYDFTIWGNRLFIRPETGFTTIIARDYSGSLGYWGSGLKHPFSNDTELNADSTKAFEFRDRKFDFGLETNISAGYRIRQRADFFIKINHHASFHPPFYSSINYYSDNGTLAATEIFTGHSTLFQIGLRFYFMGRAKNDKK
jgi:hypothetical protein